MNKIFKVIWNAKKGCNVVTSETAKGTCRFQGTARLAAAAVLGLTVVAGGVNMVSAAGNSNLNSYTVTLGDTEVSTDGLVITDGPSITKTGGINAGGKAISNVGNAVNGKDAVNLDQLKAATAGANKHNTVKAGKNVVVDSTAQNTAGGIEYVVSVSNDLKVNTVTTTDTTTGNTTTVTGNGVTITGGSGSTNPGSTVSLTADGLNNGGNQIHNVAPGTAANDVAIVGQVQEAMNGIDGALRGLDSKINTTGANAAALAGLKPIQYDPLEPTQIMAAYGHYHNKSAVAVGVAHFTNESTMFHAGVTLDDQDNMFNVGVTKKLGSSAAKKAIPERYQGGPISSVYVMNDEITALKEENARIKQENEDTKAKLAMVMAKLGL